MRAVRAVLAALLVGALLTSCSDEPEWTEATVPVPAGPPGRIALRDAVHCGDAWFAVGGVMLSRPTEVRDSRPAAWRSTDGTTWEAVPVTAQTYWGRRAVLSSVACSGDRVVAVGARSGGAHGNPRVTSFAMTDGVLDDRLAPFNLFNGDTATNVGPVTGAEPGWLITGNRVSGPAVWHSTDGLDFTIEEGVPGLADEDDFHSLAQDAAWDGEEWVVVGGGNATGTLDRDPLAWTSPDALAWEPQAVEGSPEFDDLQRVAVTDSRLVVLGLRGGRFGSWVREDGAWEMASVFGRLPEDARAAPFVSSLATSERGLWSTTSDGASYALWHSDDGEEWTEVTTPQAPPVTAGEHVLTVAAHDEQVLLLSDDATGGRIWASDD